MAKILIVVERFYPEDFLVNDLVAEWQRRGDDVEVLTQVPSYPFDRIYDGYENRRLQTTFEKLPGGREDCPVPVHRVSTVFGYNRSVKRKVLNYLHFGWRTFWWAVRHGRKYERVFVYHTAALTMASAVYPMKFLWNRPVSIWTQDLWPDAVWGFGFRPSWWKAALLNAFVRSIYFCCGRIMVSCRGFVPRIRELTGRAAEFVPQWDPTEFRPVSRPVADGRPRVFMFAGNLGKPQDLPQVVEGFLQADLRDAELWFVGGGVMLEPLRELCRARGVAEPRVRFCGRQPKAEMPQWFAQADALIISLTAEYRLTLPGKFQSYVKTGKPLVGILLGDARELIEEHGLGVTADPDDATAIAAAFRRMADELAAGRGDAYGARGKALSGKLFNREDLISRLHG